MSETAAPEAPAAGPLSMQDAMGILAARREPEATPAAPEEAAPEPDEPESEAAPTADDAADPDEPAIEGEETDETPADPELPAIAAPKSWDAQQRAAFMRAPRDVQETILARETERDAAISRALNEANTVKAQAETAAQAKVADEVKKVAELHATLSDVVTQARTAFAGKWENVDWVGFARQDPQAYTIARAEYEADVAALQRTHQAEQVARTAKQEAQRAEFQNFQRAEEARLSEIAPDLADPTEGPARKAKLATFLLGLGAPQEAVNGISALQASLAYDAMRYREAKAATASQAKPKAQSAPAPVAAAPTAAPVRATRQRTAETAKANLREKGTMEAGLALMRARRG